MQFDNLNDFKVLVHAAHGGSLTAAARALNITPAAASATLKRLEAHLGARLFERSTRAMRLTSQGQVMLDYTTRAFELLGEGESSMAADRGDLVGTLRVAAPSDLARTILLPWLREFLGAHTRVQLALSVSDRPMDVVRDEVDVAIRYGEPSDSRLVARQLVSASPILQASPRYLRGRPPIETPKDLLHHNCLTFARNGRKHRLWRFSRNGQWTEVRVDGDRSADDASLVREWAISGEGIILKSAIESKQDLIKGRLVQLLPTWGTEPYPLHAILPSGRFIPGRVRAFVDFLAMKFKRAD